MRRDSGGTLVSAHCTGYTMSVGEWVEESNVQEYVNLQHLRKN